MKKFLLTGLGVGAAVYVVRTSFQVGVFVGQLKTALEITKGLKESHEHE